MKILIGTLMGFLALTLVTPLVSASTLSTGLWVSTANLNAARRDAASVRLQDGKVLVIGGWNAASLATEPFVSAEFYDPVADSWSYAASMSTPRTFPTATLLKSGKVLVTGGANHENDWLASAELYNSTHNTWTVLAICRSASTSRARHSCRTGAYWSLVARRLATSRPTSRRSTIRRPTRGRRSRA